MLAYVFTLSRRIGEVAPRSRQYSSPPPDRKKDVDWFLAPETTLSAITFAQRGKSARVLTTEWDEIVQAFVL